MVPPYCGAVLGLVAWRVAASSAPNEKHIYTAIICVALKGLSWTPSPNGRVPKSKRKANDVTLNCPSHLLGSFGHSHVSQAIRTGHQDKCTASLSTKSTPLSFDHTFTIERATRCNPPQPTSIPPTPVEALRAAITFPRTQRQLSLLEEESVCHGQPRRNNSLGG